MPARTFDLFQVDRGLQLSLYCQAGQSFFCFVNPALTTEDLERGCQLALDYDVAGVCILPYCLQRCSKLLEESTVKLA
jgi:hypothetical protein